jgi:hypothetical protein
MNDQLSKLKGKNKVCIGTLIGSSELELAGVVDLVRARIKRNTQSKIQLTTSSFRESVGQMTGTERRAAPGKGASRSVRSALGSGIAALRS